MQGDFPMARIMSAGKKKFGKKHLFGSVLLLILSFSRDMVRNFGFISKVLPDSRIFTTTSIASLDRANQCFVIQWKCVNTIFRSMDMVVGSSEIYKLIIYHFTLVKRQSDEDNYLFLPQPLLLNVRDSTCSLFCQKMYRSRGIFHFYDQNNSLFLLDDVNRSARNQNALIT